MKMEMKQSHFITTTEAPQTSGKKALLKCRYKTEKNIRKYHDVPEKTIVKTLWLNGDLVRTCHFIYGMDIKLFLIHLRIKNF